MTELRLYRYVLIVLCLLTTLPGCRGGTPPVKAAPDPLETIPTRWIDLPEAPFVARVVDGKALLVSRTKERFDIVGTGCVFELDGRTRVAAKLIEMHRTHGVFGPREPIDGLLRTLNSLPHYLKTTDIKPCNPGAYMALVKASFGTKQVWSAEGTPWPK